MEVKVDIPWSISNLKVNIPIVVVYGNDDSTTATAAAATAAVVVAAPLDLQGHEATGTDGHTSMASLVAPGPPPYNEAIAY